MLEFGWVIIRSSDRIKVWKDFPEINRRIAFPRFRITFRNYSIYNSRISLCKSTQMKRKMLLAFVIPDWNVLICTNFHFKMSDFLSIGGLIYFYKIYIFFIHQSDKLITWFESKIFIEKFQFKICLQDIIVHLLHFIQVN